MEETTYSKSCVEPVHLHSRDTGLTHGPHSANGNSSWALPFKHVYTHLTSVHTYRPRTTAHPALQRSIQENAIDGTATITQPTLNEDLQDPEVLPSIPRVCPVGKATRRWSGAAEESAGPRGAWAGRRTDDGPGLAVRRPQGTSHPRTHEDITAAASPSLRAPNSPDSIPCPVVPPHLPAFLPAPGSIFPHPVPRLPEEPKPAVGLVCGSQMLDSSQLHQHLSLLRRPQWRGGLPETRLPVTSIHGQDHRRPKAAGVPLALTSPQRASVLNILHATTSLVKLGGWVPSINTPQILASRLYAAPTGLGLNTCSLDNLFW